MFTTIYEQLHADYLNVALKNETKHVHITM